MIFDRDGTSIITASADGTARRWSVTTGRPIGPAMLHAEGAAALALHAESHTLFTVGGDGTVRMWKLASPMKGDAKRIGLWAQVSPAMELDAHGGIYTLDIQTLQQRRQRLEQARRGEYTRPISGPMAQLTWPPYNA